MANSMYCPKCGKALTESADGKLYCKQCQTQYVVSSKTVHSASAQAKPQAKAKEKSSAPLVVLLLLLILLLGGIGGFALYHYFFGNSYTKLIQKEYAAYQAAGKPDRLMSTDEAIAQAGDLNEGEPLNVMGVVEGIDKYLISLNNGVDCYIIPEALSSADAAKIEPALGAIHVGDIVGITGMLCDTDPFTLKYCGLPYKYHERTPAEEQQSGQQKPGTQESQESPEPSDTVSNLLYQVLMREKPYMNEAGEQVYCDTENPYLTYSFAVLDMNGDGKDEAVFCSTGGYSSYTILYEYEGSIYGKDIGDQESGLQTNGLFWHGGGEEGGAARCEINGNQCEMIIEIWRRYEYNALTDTYAFQYEIRGQAATEEEYNAHIDQIGWREDGGAEAEFYDYTAENIRAVLAA